MSDTKNRQPSHEMSINDIVDEVFIYLFRGSSCLQLEFREVTATSLRPSWLKHLIDESDWATRMLLAGDRIDNLVVETAVMGL